MRYFQLIRITSGTNQVNYDDGLKSTEAEKKRLIACHIQLDEWAATDDNEVQGYHERAKVFDMPEKLFPTQRFTDPKSTLSGPRYKTVPVDLDLPAGEVFKVAIKCAASTTNLRGAYEYEIVT